MDKGQDIDYKTGEVFDVPKKILPKAITSYDLLKTIAIILMIIDHTGYYFFPDESWFRVLGRLCVPIWFFLIGYARTRDLPIRIFVGIGILAAAGMVAGEQLFPITILATLMIGRYFVDSWMGAARIGGEPLAGLFFILLLLGLPTGIAFEYGTFGLLFTVFGAMCRYRQDMPNLEDGTRYDKQMFYFVAASFICFTVLQAAPMKVLTGAQFTVLVVGMGLVYFVLKRFQGVELPTLTQEIPTFFKSIIQFTGRRTLEIYVVHLVAFKMMALYYMPERFQFLQWSWTHEKVEDFLSYIFIQ